MRQSSQARETTETKIKLNLQLDESTNVSIQTGVGFSIICLLYLLDMEDLDCRLKQKVMYLSMHITPLKMLNCTRKLLERSIAKQRGN